MLMRSVLDCTPHPQAVFNREDDQRKKFDDRKTCGVALRVLGDGFERDRNQIDHNQADKKPIDRLVDAITHGPLFEYLINAPAQASEAIACHVATIPLPECQPPSAASIALSASSAFDPSGPPACAMSERPPPPLPPSASAPFLTSSTALKRLVRSSVTPTTMPALPSAAVATMATTPDPTCRLPSSARLRRSLSSIPVTARASSLTPLTCRTSAASPSAFPPPPIASFFLASERSRSSFLRSSKSVPMRPGISSSGTLSSAAAALTT